MFRLGRLAKEQGASRCKHGCFCWEPLSWKWQARLQAELFERSKKPVSAFSARHLLEPRQSELGDLTDDTLVAFAARPEDIILFVAGASGAGAHTLCLPSFGNTRAVTVALPPAPGQHGR